MSEKTSLTVPLFSPESAIVDRVGLRHHQMQMGNMGSHILLSVQKPNSRLLSVFLVSIVKGLCHKLTQANVFSATFQGKTTQYYHLQMWDEVVGVCTRLREEAPGHLL